MFPTGLAFLGDKDDFKVLVVESGTGLHSDCNDNTLPPFGGKYSPNNPFTPDLIVLDKNGRRIAGPYFKPTSPHDGYQADGPAIGLVFERGTEGGKRSEEHTSELQSHLNLVCRLLLEKNNNQ